MPRDRPESTRKITKCFDGENACAELVLQIILGQPKLRVREVRTQVFLENLLHRSVRLDVLAVDSRGRRMNGEIQRDDRGAGRKRALWGPFPVLQQTAPFLV